MSNQWFEFGDTVRQIFKEKDQSANEKMWDWFLNNKTLKLRTRGDLDQAGADIFSIARGTGTAVANFSVGTKLNLKASASAGAGLNLDQGSAPSAPVNGDVWLTADGMYYMANDTTYGPVEKHTKSFLIGNGSSTEFVINHGLNTQDITVTLWDVASSPVELVLSDVYLGDLSGNDPDNKIVVAFGAPIAANEIKVVITR
jgi:hypothetical protein